MRIAIYGLVDPAAPGVIRYVGSTDERSLTARLDQHCDPRVDLASNPAKAAWIRSVLKTGQRPAIVVLAWVSEEHRWSVVRAMRQGLLEAGHPLTNVPVAPKKSGQESREAVRERNQRWRARVRADATLHANYLQKAAARKRRRIAENL